MRVDRLAGGLWRWTADAPDGAEGNGVYHEHPDGIVLIDPLLPADAGDAERFWRALDRDVERIGRPPVVASTLPDRDASARAVVARYAGARVVADAALAAAGALPGGVEALLPGPPAAAGRALLSCACHGLLWTADLLDDPAAAAALVPRLVATAPRVVIAAHGDPIVDDPAGWLARQAG
jgi:hypothetical protein